MLLIFNPELIFQVLNVSQFNSGLNLFASPIHIEFVPRFLIDFMILIDLKDKRDPLNVNFNSIFIGTEN